MGPFIAIGHFAPNVDLEREDYHPLYDTVSARSVFSFLLGISCIILIPPMTSIAYGLSILMLSTLRSQALYEYFSQTAYNLDQQAFSCFLQSVIQIGYQILLRCTKGGKH